MIQQRNVHESHFTFMIRLDGRGETLEQYLNVFDVV